MTLFTQLFKTGVLFLIYVICFSLVIRAIIEAFASGSSLGSVQGFCTAITEPFVAPVRKLLEKMGVPDMGIDLSMLVTCFFLATVAELLEKLVP